MPQSSARGVASILKVGPVALRVDAQRGLEALLNDLPGMAYRCRVDPDWTAIFVSEGSGELTGYSADAFFGTDAIRFNDLIHPDDRAMVWEGVQSALAAQRSFELRYRIRTAGGDEKWVSERGRGVFAADGTVDTLEGFVTDITELKRTEATLREHDEMVTLAFSNARDMMLLAQVEPGPLFRVQSVNRRYVDVIRAAGITTTSEQLVGLTFSELRALFPFPDDKWEELMKRYRTVVETKVPINYDEVSETPNGLYYGQSTISPVCDETGVCRFVLYASADVTSRKRAEEALRESEEKFAKAFRASAGAMAISEPGGRGFIEVNDGYVRMFGYSREELIGRTLGELQIWGTPDEQQRFAKIFAEKRSIRDMEVVRRRRDGTFITCLLSSEPIELQGRACILSSLYDITARRQAEQALRDSEERFSKAFRAVPDAVFITEFESGRVVDVNEGCLRIYGYSRDDCIGRTSMDLGLWADPKDRLRLLEALRAGGGTARDVEIIGRTRSGGLVNVLVSCESIELDGRAHLVTIAHDITERKRGEQALRDSEEKFAKAFRASPGAIGISDVTTLKFVEVNDGYCRMFGYTREEMIGATGMELGLWGNVEEREKVMQQFLAKGSVEDMEVVGRRRDGTLINCIIRAERLELGGRPHLVSALNDITARRRGETQRATLEAQLRQAQKLDALGQLAGGIAHDFNNILTGISAYTELALMDSDRPEEVRSHLTHVRRAGDRAADLVRQILTFSRQTAQERKPIRLHVVMREAIKLLRSSIPKTITMVEQLETMAPVVLADATQIHQVVMNLCTNAAHAMRDRPGKLSVTLDTLKVGAAASPEETNLQPGSYARITISDAGHGMDEATIARIFEPFFTTKGPGEGTGLGLSVVHGIIEDHDGVISVRSTPGQGTTFQLCLPEHGDVVPSELETNADLPRGNGERILFVDDESTISTAAGQLLRIIGYRVFAHTDPRQAWAAFEASPADFDIVITDLTMPHLTGLEVTRRVLAKRPDMPVLIATGQSVPWTPESIRALGIRGLVPKPLTVAKLARALRAALSEKPM